MQSANSPSVKPNVLFIDLISRIHENWVAEKRCKLETKPKEEDFDTTFSNEIRALMYASGDVRDSNWISVLTLTKHLRSYLNSILNDANKMAKLRGDKFLQHQSMLFLLRKDKEKLQRLITYLKIKDYKGSLTKKYVEFDEETTEEGPRVYDCLQFLGEILSSREVNRIRDLKVMDQMTQRRLQRNDSRTLHMTNEEYLEFSEQQKCSFLKNGFKYFENWLMQVHVTSLQPTTLTLEIINFLMRDYIIEVIDEVLLERERQKKAFDLSSPSQKSLLSKPEAFSTPSRRLSGLKEQTPPHKRLESRQSRISSIVNVYHSESRKLQSLNRSSEEDAPILPDEIISAAKKLQVICSPFTVKESFIKASTTAPINLSAPTTHKTQTTPSKIVQKHANQVPSRERFEPRLLSSSNTLSKNVEFSNIAPKPSTSSDRIDDSDSSVTSAEAPTTSTRPRRKIAPPKRYKF